VIWYANKRKIKKGDKYVLNGSKTFITNGVYADYYIVAAKTDVDAGNKGISIFQLIPRRLSFCY
jgi:alkylation response protein AidB-like acyl-CoA dehydrogenase